MTAVPLLDHHTGGHCAPRLSLFRRLVAAMPSTGSHESESCEWRPVLDYEGLYEVSSDGRVRSLPRPRTRGRILVPRVNGNGYLQLKLCASGVPLTRKVHQLVCEAFRGPRQEGQVVRHLDGNRLNNCASNLAWGTPSENMQDSVRHGTNHEASKTHCGNGHEFTADNTYRPPSGGRKCKACDNNRRRARRQQAHADQMRAAAEPYLPPAPRHAVTQPRDSPPWPAAERPFWADPPKPDRSADTRFDLPVARPYAPWPVYGEAPVLDVDEAQRRQQAHAAIDALQEDMARGYLA